MTDHLGGVIPVYPCSWCGERTSHQIVEAVMRALTFGLAAATGWALAWAALTIADRITTTRRTERLAFEAEAFLLLEGTR